MLLPQMPKALTDAEVRAKAVRRLRIARSQATDETTVRELTRELRRVDPDSRHAQARRQRRGR